MVIGNSLDETAYHEAGHITVAAAVGLDLQHKGIVVYEVGNVGDGWAFYWEDNQQWTDILVALRAGQLAQLKKFPGSDFQGAQTDVQKFSYIVEHHFPPGTLNSDMWEAVTRRATNLLDLNPNWSAVEDVARAVINTRSVPVAPGEHAQATLKKHLDGNAIAAILAPHIPRVRVR
jgi:hypothetical protein